MIKYAARVNGLTALAINHVDTIGKLPKSNGQETRNFPCSLKELAQCEPVYEEFDGWDEDISNVKSFDDLPDNAKNKTDWCGEGKRADYSRAFDDFAGTQNCSGS